MSNFNQIESLFAADCGYADTRHKVNLCRRAVPQALLDGVEKGCSLETLEELAKGFPICKYKTQITIHGSFPELSTRRIGGYVNLVRNQNKSVGVRWTAIDHEKKARLFREAKICAGFGVYETSSAFFIRKVERITAANDDAVLASFREAAAKIDRSLFFGDVSIFTGYVWAQKFAVFQITVNAFPERNYDLLAEQITGLPKDERERIIAEHEAEMKRQHEELMQEIEERRRQREEKDREVAKANAAWLEANPAPFPVRKGYTLRLGDIYAKLAKDREGRITRWKFRKVSKAFGRLIAIPCDIDGNKVEEKVGVFGRPRKGREIRVPTGDYSVKSA